MADRKSPLHWEEETRFDGPEHWGGDPRWKHLFPKSGAPGTFVPVDIEGMAVDSTDDDASQIIDGLDDMLDAGRSHHGGRDQKKSGESRRWRQGKETEPPSSSSRRYSEDEEDAWLFGDAKLRSRVTCDLSESSSEEVEFNENTAGIVGMESTVKRSKPRRALGEISAGSQKMQGKEAASAGSERILDKSFSSGVRSPGRGSFSNIDESRESACEDIDSDDSGILRNDRRKRKSTSFDISPRHGLMSMEKTPKGSIIRRRARRRAAHSSASESSASKCESPLSVDTERYAGGASSHESRSGGKKPRPRALTDKEGWILKGAFRGSEAAIRKNKNRRLKQQRLNFPVELDD